MFAFTIDAASVDDITESAIADQLATFTRLTEFEKSSMIPAGLASAKALAGALEHGPFLCTFTGVDNLALVGETTKLAVSVTTDARYVAPPPVVASDPTPDDENAEDANSGEPAEVVPATSEAPAEDVAPVIIDE